jgi:hypothetical protein
MLMKIHESYRNVVALADKELLGKKFTQNNKQLDLTTTFYDGEDIEEEKAIPLLQQHAEQDATFNIIGKKSVETAKKAGIITEELISTVDNIPFAILLL